MSTQWKFFKKFEIPDAVDRTCIYLRRWNLIVTPWFSIKVHNIRLPDGDRALHDHPWRFTSIILKGGYTEEIPMDPGQGYGLWNTEFIRRGRFSRHTVQAAGLHRIHWVDPDTWTLVFTRGHERVWGFSPDAGQWISWYEFLGVDAASDD